MKFTPRRRAAEQFIKETGRAGRGLSDTWAAPHRPPRRDTAARDTGPPHRRHRPQARPPPPPCSLSPEGGRCGGAAGSVWNPGGGAHEGGKASPFVPCPLRRAELSGMTGIRGNSPGVREGCGGPRLSLPPVCSTTGWRLTCEDCVLRCECLRAPSSPASLPLAQTTGSVLGAAGGIGVVECECKV